MLFIIYYLFCIVKNELMVTQYNKINNQINGFIRNKTENKE